MLSTTTLALDDPDKLRSLMTSRGFTVRSLAKASGSSPARIGQLTTGRDQSIAAGTAVSIATALDVDVDQLFSFPDGEALVQLGLIRGY